eukprot:GEZU01016563.1.p1 GENE.GEZU01016563.1~~GEZU01016563.1.p1  ORF type:complete len:107 (-),score=30.95 GEZU01016563.1:20-340(-)
MNEFFIEIFEEYHHPSLGLRFSESNEPMTLDVFIPSLSLAFEYQGAQHYRDLPLFANSAMTQHRDTEKAAACKRAQITLIIVPYWWDRSVSALASAIRNARPDLQL